MTHMLSFASLPQIKAVKTGSVFWGSFSALAYFYMVSDILLYVISLSFTRLQNFEVFLMTFTENRLSGFYTIQYNTIKGIATEGLRPIYCRAQRFGCR